jgi:hypothetical protein
MHLHLCIGGIFLEVHRGPIWGGGDHEHFPRVHEGNVGTHLLAAEAEELGRPKLAMANDIV